MDLNELEQAIFVRDLARLELSFARFSLVFECHCEEEDGCDDNEEAGLERLERGLEVIVVGHAHRLETINRGIVLKTIAEKLSNQHSRKSQRKLTTVPPSAVIWR